VHSLAGATPAQIRELMRHMPEEGSLTSIGIHGTALHPVLLEEIVNHWPRVTVNSGYGTTETNGSVASISGETLRRYPHCAGRVLPTIEVRIVGLDGFDVEPGEIGEVWLRGASLMHGYCTEGGSVEGLADCWFKTGDLGWLSPHRFLSIVDRVNHVIETGNRRISALELERAVTCDAGVAEAAVLCELTAETSSGRQGKEGISVVVVAVPKFGATLDGEGIRRVVAERGSVAANAVMVVEAPLLPKDRSGKVNRTELRAMLAQRSESLKWLDLEAPP
jgi:long-chain acyl-CoA synthetase